MSDIRLSASWKSDRGKIETGKSHHIAIIVDGGPKVIAFVIDGVLCKGGNRKFGWGRFRRDFRDPNGGAKLKAVGFRDPQAVERGPLGWGLLVEARIRCFGLPIVGE